MNKFDASYFLLPVIKRLVNLGAQLFGAIYFGILGLILGVLLSFILASEKFGFASKGDLIVSTGMSLGLLGSAFTLFFYTPLAHKRSLIYRYSQGSFSGVVLGVLFWPFTGLSLGLIEIWKGMAKNQGILSHSIKKAGPFLSEVFTPLGWTIVAMISFGGIILGCLGDHFKKDETNKS